VSGRRPGRDRPRPAFVLLTVAVLVFLIAFPWLGPGYRLLSFAATTATAAIVLYGLVIPFGQAGILSLGYAALMGVGAYTAAILSRDAGFTVWETLPAAAVMAALAAFVLGLPILRTSGHHFAIVTFVSCELLRIVLVNGGRFTGAATGLDLPPIGTWLGINFDKLANTYLLLVAVLLLAMLATYLVSRSRWGRTLRSIRENETLAKSIGVHTNVQKMIAFVVSGLFAGVAGALQAYNLRHISPDLYTGFASVYLALMAMLGGPRLILGPLVGAVIVTFLPEAMNIDPVDSRIAYGIALIAVIMLLPGGVLAGLARLYDWATAARQATSRLPVPAADPRRTEPQP
jgi:branched-chain amino acid transport system permease protein